MTSNKHIICRLIGLIVTFAVIIVFLAVFYMNNKIFTLNNVKESEAEKKEMTDKEVLDSDCSNMEMGDLAYVAYPYITCGNKLYYHTENISSRPSLSRLNETVYGICGETVEYEVYSETGGLSEKVYLRVPNGDIQLSTKYWPLFWAYDYVCDTDIMYNGQRLYGRYLMYSAVEWEFNIYGLNGENVHRLHYYPGRRLQRGDIEVYKCLTDEFIFKVPVNNLYMLKINTANLNALADTMTIEEPVIIEDLYLLASPDWENFYNLLSY